MLNTRESLEFILGKIIFAKKKETKQANLSIARICIFFLEIFMWNLKRKFFILCLEIRNQVNHSNEANEIEVPFSLAEMYTRTNRSK